MPVSLSVFGGVGWQFFDDNGTPLAGGKINTYLAGTTTPVATYTTSTGAVAHTNPIILNAGGRVPGGEIWLTDGVLHKFVVTTSTNVLIATYDNVTAGPSSNFSVDTFLSDGIQTQFLLSLPADSANSTQVYINGIYQQKNTYSVSGRNLTFSETPPVTASIEVVYI